MNRPLEVKERKKLKCKQSLTSARARARTALQKMFETSFSDKKRFNLDRFNGLNSKLDASGKKGVFPI